MEPLHGVRVIELGGIGPAPFCGMLLAGLGADVVRIERPETRSTHQPRGDFDTLSRHRRILEIDLKGSRGLTDALDLIGEADVLLEGFRPGVAERLGVGPETICKSNPQLVYARITGWGREGSLSSLAGHDINYLGVSGVLDAIGSAGGPPIVPLNLIADFGGGGMMAAVSILAALLERSGSGRGQVVDVTMLDAAAMLATSIFGRVADGSWIPERGRNFIDSGAPFYGVYQTADHRYVTVGAIEPRFYADLLKFLGLPPSDPIYHRQWDRAWWESDRERLAAIFVGRTRDDWCRTAQGDLCIGPVLGLAEAIDHPLNKERGLFVEVGNVLQPRLPAQFSRTALAKPRASVRLGGDGRSVLREWRGLDASPEQKLP